MAGRGGYQKPGSPAAVSGPGALSQRTDGGPGDKQAISRLPNAKYGESKDYEDIQSGAPVGAAGGPGGGGGMDRASLPGFMDDSARTGEPVTTGADLGAGAGSEVLGLPSESGGDIQALVAMLPVLEFMANRPNASPSTRALIRRIKSEM